MLEILKIFLLAMTPIGELRAAIPAGILMYSLDWKIVFVVSVLGNLVPVIVLLLLLGPVSDLLCSSSPFFNKFFNWVFERTRRKTESRITKYGEIALISFVAIPLPFTGAWTGAVAAFLFNIPFKRAFLLISLGVLISGTIVLLLTERFLWLI